MSVKLRRNGVIRLPIVDVDLVLQGFKNSRTRRLVYGARLLSNVKATQMLEAAKRDQIDGHVSLDDKDLGLLLQAMSLTNECIMEFVYDEFDEDDEQI